MPTKVDVEPNLKQTEPETKLLSITEVLAMTGISKSTIFRYMKNERAVLRGIVSARELKEGTRFPLEVKTVWHASFWKLSDIEEWMKNRIKYTTKGTS